MMCPYLGCLSRQLARLTADRDEHPPDHCPGVLEAQRATFEAKLERKRGPAVSFDDDRSLKHRNMRELGKSQSRVVELVAAERQYEPVSWLGSAGGHCPYPFFRAAFIARNRAAQPGFSSCTERSSPSASASTLLVITLPEPV